jgi:hypothetical protein
MTKRITNENYLGNPNLKCVGVEQEFTEEQVEEYIKCSQDPLYFISNYVKIVTLDEGLQNFKPWDFQENLLETIHDNRFVICKFPRQTGKSTCVISYLLHYTLFNPDVRVGILANKQATARELLHRLKLAYENLPMWLQQGVEEWNKSTIELENGSKVIASATSSSAVRGGSFNMIFLDEFAYVPHGVAEEFFSSVYPTISSGQSTKVLIVSTPKGLNMFYKMWVDAEQGRNSYVPVEVHWSAVPGRDEVWKQETIANTSEEQFRVEFECDFVGSVNTLISPAKLRTLPFLSPTQQSEEGLKIYRDPVDGHEYIMSVDVSRGKGIDYHAFTVIDISEVPYRVVATFKNNTMAPMLLPNVIEPVAKKYNNAYCVVEINDIGGQVADIMHQEMEYENMLHTTMGGMKGQTISSGMGSKKSRVGVRTTKAVKRTGCSILKSMIEEDKLIPEDYDIISELNTYVSQGTSFQAEKGHHDDLVATLVVFAWVTSQKYFQDLTDTDIRTALYKEQMKEVEEQLMPFGIIDDGLGGGDAPEIDSEGNVWHDAGNDEFGLPW